MHYRISLHLSIQSVSNVGHLTVTNDGKPQGTNKMSDKQQFVATQMVVRCCCVELQQIAQCTQSTSKTQFAQLKA